MFNTMFECFKKEIMIFELIAFMEKHTEGFTESRENYIECLNMLRAELDESAAIRYTVILPITTDMASLLSSFLMRSSIVLTMTISTD